MKNHLLKITILILIAILIYFSPIKIIYVQGNSMYPTLKDKQFLIGLETSNFNKNDIVVAKIESNYLIKRIKFIEGETIYYLLKKEEEMPLIIDENFYLNYKVTKNDELLQKFKVEMGKVFLLGDNKNLSDDSRRFGCVDKESLKYKIIFPRF